MTSPANACPLLYSFRRCPYAIRARMALAQAGIKVELREVLLRDKPQAMTALSPKGTVPVLQLPDRQVIDESLDVMLWALRQNDPDGWLHGPQGAELIEQNDGPFKSALDRYKYFTRHPQQPREFYRQQGEQFLQRLEEALAAHDGRGLVRNTPSLADIAIFPFIRQFAAADRQWFADAPYPLLREWLGRHRNSPLFRRCMHKHRVWREGDTAVIEAWPVGQEQPQSG